MFYDLEEGKDFFNRTQTRISIKEANSDCTRLRIPIVQKYPGKNKKCVVFVSKLIRKKYNQLNRTMSKNWNSLLTNEHTQMVHKIQKLKAPFH